MGKKMSTSNCRDVTVKSWMKLVSAGDALVGGRWLSQK